MKFKEYLNESKIPKGLLNWVKDYQSARISGNIKLAKSLKKSIDSEIKKLKLDPNEVYFYFGDPDKKTFGDRRSFDYGTVIPDRRK